AASRQHRRGDRDRRYHEDRERILESAGEEQQRSQLKDVVPEIKRRLALAEAAGGATQPAADDVDEGRRRDDRRSGTDRQRVAESVMYDDEARRLADDRDP